MVKKIYKILFIILILFVLELITRNGVYAATVDSITVYVESGTIYDEDGKLLKKGDEITGDIAVERNSIFKIKVRYDCHLGLADDLKRDVIESSDVDISAADGTLGERTDKDGAGTGDYYVDIYPFQTKDRIANVDLKITGTIYFSTGWTGTWGAMDTEERVVSVEIGKSERDELREIEENMDALVRGKIIEKEITESFSNVGTLFMNDRLMDEIKNRYDNTITYEDIKVDELFSEEELPQYDFGEDESMSQLAYNCINKQRTIEFNASTGKLLFLTGCIENINEDRAQYILRELSRGSNSCQMIEWINDIETNKENISTDIMERCIEVYEALPKIAEILGEDKVDPENYWQTFTMSSELMDYLNDDVRALSEKSREAFLAGLNRLNSDVKESLNNLVKLLSENRVVWPSFTDVLTEVDKYTEKAQNHSEDTTKFANMINVALTIISNIGMVVAVLMSSILGIKYMLGSVEEKVDIKKDMIPYLIGAGLLFGISAILKIVQGVGNTINKL